MAKILKLTFLIGLLLPTPICSYATTYYVDSVAGLDSNNGTSTATPWATIAHVSAQAFAPSDSILFKKGYTWHEQLNVPGSGIAGHPITFGAYGASGSAPIIDGANVVVAPWAHYRGNIYVAKIGVVTPPNSLYVDGVWQELARYPTSKYLLTTKASSNRTSVIDSGLGALLGANSIVGSTIVTRSSPWSASAHPITAFDSGTGTVTTGSNIAYPMPLGYGFFFRNALWMLQAPGEWFYDGKGNLYVWTRAGDSPAKHTIAISNRSYGINIGNKSFIHVSGIKVTYPQTTSVYASHGAGIVVNNVSMYGGVSGVDFSCNGGIVENSSVEGASGYGIVMHGSNNTITNNKLYHIGDVAIAPDVFQPTSILVDGSSNGISGNTATYNGYIGIRADGSYNQVKNNIIDQFCLKLDDGGGIHTWSRSAANTDIGIVISGNTVSNSIGNVTGTSMTSSTAMGIYLDENSHDVSVQNNVVTYVDCGIFIHNSYDNTIIGNRCFSSKVAGIFISKNSTAGIVHNNLIVDNVFETLSTTTGPAKYINQIESAANFGTYNKNSYYHPNTPAVVTQRTKTGSLNYNLSDWQTASGEDMQSTDVMGKCPETISLPIKPD